MHYHLLKPRHNGGRTKISEIWHMGAVTRDKSRTVCDRRNVSIKNYCLLMMIEHGETNCSLDSQSSQSLKAPSASVRPQTATDVASLPPTPP